jgi:hypothetical protein
LPRLQSVCVFGGWESWGIISIKRENTTVPFDASGGKEASINNHRTKEQNTTMIQIKINTKSKVKEALKPVRCKTDSVKSTTDTEKDKKTKKDKPVKTTVKTVKCDLENSKSPKNQFRRKLGTQNSNDVVMDKAALDDLLGTTNVKAGNKKTNIDLETLRNLLGVEGKSIEEVLTNKTKKDVAEMMKKENVTSFAQRKKQKERDALKRKKLDKEEMVNPMKSIERDFSTLANGIMEEDINFLNKDEIQRAFQTIVNALEKSSEEAWGEDELYREVKDAVKKNCVPGNVFHKAPGTDGAGQFTNKKDAGSWSLQWSKSDSDCKGGVASMSGGSERFTKKPCGREDKDGGKSKNKCGKET